MSGCPNVHDTGMDLSFSFAVALSASYAPTLILLQEPEEAGIAMPII